MSALCHQRLNSVEMDYDASMMSPLSVGDVVVVVVVVVGAAAVAVVVVVVGGCPLNSLSSNFHE